MYKGYIETIMLFKNKVNEVIKVLIYNFFEHNVGKSSAAIAYYLVFALFPLLIFVSNLLGLLNLDVESIIKVLIFVLPGDIVEIIGNYLEYVTVTSSPSLLWFSLIFSIYFPMRVARGLMDNVRLAYKLKKPTKPVFYVLRQFSYTFVLFLTITLTLFLSIMGHRVLEYITDLPFVSGRMNISDFLFTLWDYLRFLIVGVVMFGALSALYIMAQDKRESISSVLPGTVTALIAWLLVSIGFSAYVENFANYSVVYGTLGTVIVLLIWLYLTSVILILGSELNVAIKNVRSDDIGKVN